jgi:ABC-2 type transport system ATP-binding protein
MKNKIVEVHNLCLRLAGKPVLNQLSAAFEQGETVLIAGKNGSGKSSFLRCLAGIYFADEGEIEFGRLSSRKKLGFISDKMSLLEHWTLAQGIDFHCRVYGVAAFNPSLIDELHLPLNRKIKHLSSGERAIYHLSLLISQQPELLLVDEVIHMMDPYMRELFLDTLIDLIAEFNTTVIMVNQTFAETGRLPERIVVMEEGGFVLDEKSEQLTQKVKKVVTDQPLESDLPVLFKKESPLLNEYFIYPFKPEWAKKYSLPFQGVDLTEIIKAFIGGYYDKKRV